MIISSDLEFLKYLQKLGVIQNSLNTHCVIVLNKTITELRFSYCSSPEIKFEECIFLNCRFDFFEFNGIEFIKSKFSNCVFQNTSFMDCNITDCIFENSFSNTLLFGMTLFKRVKFNKMEFQFTTFSDCQLHDVQFNDGWFQVGKFESGDYTYAFKSRILFSNVSLSSVIFKDLDLSETIFKECEIGINFINCNLSSYTFIKNTSPSISSIDFSTIIRSENLPKMVLKSTFGISKQTIKDIIVSLTTESKFHSVFISYSSKDETVARELQRLLRKNGIDVFFWKTDALGGRKLKHIMIDAIREYDKFLFIASEYSLKSETCHYEISEARNKYNKNWDNIFVPIHIDNSLFNIRKENIPKKLASTYWENIEDLKEFNSLDFIFAKNIKSIKSSNEFRKLLVTIKIKNDGYIN